MPSFIIKRLPVRFRFDNNYFDHSYQGVPINGYTEMIKRMLDGSDVILGEDYLDRKWYWDDKADFVIYTGMLDAYFDFCYGKLKYRSLRFEHEVLDIDNYQGVSNMNYTNKDVPYTRIIEHKFFEFGKQDKTVITREYPVEFSDGMEPYYPINDYRNNELVKKYNALAVASGKVLFGGRLAEYKYYDMDKVVLKSMMDADKICASL